ncbi:hypothetical protein OG874_21395 [Nocardia sp. NBC_00565]|uniref:hypothetical protein n=1 Tax=Nocardia sp. NBC_00565 TaxID=2975993 RepID=UPI002E81EEBC|nr:hypothetical protein [Nocardia sp. NBC_00565]WUC07483.1 hypothetical protein OG874_21395 [Nocardia sp. NBC_00565]
MPEPHEPRSQADPHLTDLLTVLDDFLRCPDLPVFDLLTEFMNLRGSRHAGFDACNLVDDLSFTAYHYRNDAGDEVVLQSQGPWPVWAARF